MSATEISRRFEGKVVVITAAASGIGLASAKRFYDEGALLCLSDIDREGLEACVSEFTFDPERCVTHQLDVSDYNAVKAYMAEIDAKHGRIDVLVNNAGQGSWGSVIDLSVERWHSVIGVTLNSVFFTCKEAMPQLLRCRGSIVNTSSISGMFGDNGFAAYNAAKAGVINLTRALAIDHAAEGVRANAVCPGLTDTPRVAWMKQNEEIAAEYDRRLPMRRAGTAEEVASAIAFLASRDATYITGVALPVDGGLTAATGQPSFLRLLPDRR